MIKIIELLWVYLSIWYFKAVFWGEFKVRIQVTGIPMVKSKDPYKVPVVDDFH